MGNGHKQIGDPITTHEPYVRSVQYSPNGRLLASSGGDGKLELWDVTLRKLVVQLEEHASVTTWTITWSPDGKRIAAGSTNNQIRVFDVAKRQLAIPPIDAHKGSVNILAYSPDGSFLASGSDDQSVRLWRADTGKAARCPFRGHKSVVLGVAWSPDGQRLVTGGAKPCPYVCVWDVHKGQMLFNGPLRIHRHTDWIWGVTYSPDGDYFATADTEVSPIQVWDARTGKALLPLIVEEEERKLREQEQDALSNDQHQFHDSGKMRTGGTITAVAWGLDGQRFMSAEEDRGIQIWDGETGLQVGEAVRHQKSVSAVSISGDGTVAIASDDATISIFDINSGELLAGPLTGHTDAILTLRLSLDGSRIVSGGKDKTIRFWHSDTGKMAHIIEAHTASVCALSLSKAETKLASGAEDNTILVWDWQTYERIAGPFYHDDCVRAVCFSPDGMRLLSGSDDCTARVWDIASGKSAFDPMDVHSGSVGAVDWSSDGLKLLTTGAHDWTICVWDATTGARLHEPLDGHDGGVKAAVFSPDCKRILSGSMDGTLCVWDAVTGRILLDKTEPNNQEASDDRSHSPDDPQEGISTERRDRMRQHSDDSIMNMPATISRKNKQRSQGRGFWDDVDHEGGHGTGTQKTDKKRQRKHGWLGNMWRSTHNFESTPTQKQNTKRKGKHTAGGSAEGHVMRRIHHAEVERVTTARDKLRVLAAGDNPHARHSSQEEPESDGGSDSPIDPTDPNPTHGDVSSDDESVHGLVDTICFCLCLPCCK
ncbi:WD40 repeat-like protein [Coniophora puteana RWD-64-598 SS2]|uniref:WD40 repeat-like protein n=1 Tax=Coniophora puteana (strain RWD-64-598) TaxID=741705 RepID=A0A5M3MDL6_CONPW|nr:WD40 repeat-like protein [Coniophora puteana RWD-64-598 SS2]EIW76934.1 WD40 repeat-like protein [Coniophora puteana RWD-64-598 SS2]